MERHGERWSDEEIEKLKKLYPKYDKKHRFSSKKWEKLSEEFKRTREAVKSKAREFFSDKDFKRTELTDWIAFDEVTGEKQTCSYCQKKMEKGEVGLTIRERCSSHYSASQYNIWIHLGCVPDFLKTIEEGFEEHKEDLIVEAL